MRIKIAKLILKDYYTNKEWFHWNRYNKELAELVVREINNNNIVHIGQLNAYIFNFIYKNPEKFYKTGSFYKRLAFINMFNTQKQLPPEPNQYLQTLPEMTHKNVKRQMRGPRIMR